MGKKDKRGEGSGANAEDHKFRIRQFLLYLLRHVWEYSWVSWSEVEWTAAYDKSYTLEEMQEVAENAWRKDFKYFECQAGKVRAIRREGKDDQAKRRWPEQPSGWKDEESEDGGQGVSAKPPGKVRLISREGKDDQAEPKAAAKDGQNSICWRCRELALARTAIRVEEGEEYR